MNLHISTPYVWGIDGDFWPQSFLAALPHLCREGDCIVLGCYDPSDVVREELLKIGKLASELPLEVDASCFDINRDEHPRGCAFQVPFSLAALDLLARLAKLKSGGGERDLFFDDFIVFRDGPPVRPLIFFHLAFPGGDPGGFLSLDGSYAEEEISAFAVALGARPVLLPNRGQLVVPQNVKIRFGTRQLWKIKGKVDPVALLTELRRVCRLGDALVLGVFDPTPAFREAILKVGIVAVDLPPEVDVSCFISNRDSHPDGCPFLVLYSSANLEFLVSLFRAQAASVESTPVYYDLVVFRGGQPVTSLLSYSANALFLGATYGEAVARAFAEALKCEAALVSPERYHLS